MLMDAPNKEFALAGSLEELKAKGRLVVHGAHRPILVIYNRGRIFALDNRCPHVGFPLERGSVGDGILTCHWHHARFDLESGCLRTRHGTDAGARAPASRGARQPGKTVWRGMIGDLTRREDELGGKTLLIVGLGQIGGRLAQLAKAFDMRVIGIAPRSTSWSRSRHPRPRLCG
jgi:nitrite reductase/ring-hydroxylating ferredoxin subunit